MNLYRRYLFIIIINQFEIIKSSHQQTLPDTDFWSWLLAMPIDMDVPSIKPHSLKRCDSTGVIEGDSCLVDFPLYDALSWI